MAVMSNQPAQMRPAPSLGTILHYSGAAASLALVAIIAVWGVKLAVRDVSGVPVVRAAAGAMRVSPDAPGGEISPDLGLAVNAVAALGEAEGPGDVLLLAPTQPDLTEEDLEAQPMAEAGEVGLGSSLTVAPDATATPEASATEPAPQTTDINALIASIVAGEAPAAPLDEGEAMPEEVDGAAAAEPVAEPVIAPVMAAPDMAVVQQRRPMPRPASVTASAAVQTAATPVAATGFAAEPPEGAQIVQLGAFPTAELAQSEWQRIQSLATPYLAGKTPFIQEAQSSGGTFYRLRAFGFADDAEARGFCNAFEGLNLNCITVASR